MAFKRIVTNTLARADVVVNGERPWDIQVHNERFYRRAARGTLGLGESYMDGDWDVESLDALFRHFVTAELRSSLIYRLNHASLVLRARLRNLQSKRRSLAVAEEHYDLDHRMYEQFLGPWNQYTCCFFFNDDDDLRQAEVNKLEIICNKLEIDENDRVLDIGCGWGGFAKYAAATRGCELTGVTISTEQAQFARDHTEGLPVDIVLSDYRDLPSTLDSKYDKILICGMLEHVGYKNYRSLMQVVSHMLDDDGLFLLHTIGNSDETLIADRWIEKYIFRNSMAPSLPQLAAALQGPFTVHAWENYGHYYSSTLQAWYDKFEKNWDNIAALESKHAFDEKFRRMWRYYLLSSKAMFDVENLLLWQIVMSKAGKRTSVYDRVAR
ncbi:MAG: cyclopropane fatty acyl phospholipid synthase [Woeseiaceae bacterium]|nr:cyclopropane fatty acyl phospholipid synthase [Woeseiaceae bacterium]NIP20006.1 cyclopropane fatty acyl phospholipid synthase [Woeseiaceae bacterium]NIS88802.1 cyclopropane fatty acyl phospholipid synthase [Woeseiaceae bacterium]